MCVWVCMGVWGPVLGACVFGACGLCSECVLTVGGVCGYYVLGMYVTQVVILLRGQESVCCKREVNASMSG